MLKDLLLAPARLILDHQGTCHCGRRTYRFSQCDKCTRLEAAERRQEALAQQDAPGAEGIELGYADNPPPQAGVVRGVCFLTDGEVRRLAHRNVRRLAPTLATELSSFAVEDWIPAPLSGGVRDVYRTVPSGGGWKVTVPPPPPPLVIRL